MKLQLEIIFEPGDRVHTTLNQFWHVFGQIEEDARDFWMRLHTHIHMLRFRDMWE
jgi:hypothetical protein